MLKVIRNQYMMKDVHHLIIRRDHGMPAKLEYSYEM